MEEIQPTACLMYVDSGGKYRCTVDHQTITFVVQGMIKLYTLLLHFNFNFAGSRQEERVDSKCMHDNFLI